MKPIALSRKQIYQSRWVNLYVDRVQFPNGAVIEQHHLLDFDHPAVMAVPYQEDRFLMVKVCRYPTGRAEWEFPAGSIEKGENVIQAAQREVLEETGYLSTGHRILYDYFPMNGIANQVFYVVSCEATDLVDTFDPDEISAVRWFGIDEIWRMIRDRGMKDGYSLTAFLLVQNLSGAEIEG